MLGDFFIANTYTFGLVVYVEFPFVCIIVLTGLEEMGQGWNCFSPPNFIAQLRL